MNLPDAPIAHEGFFVTHFLAVRDQEKSKDFYVRILGGKVIKPENPCYIKLANTWILEAQLARRRRLGLLQTMARQRSVLSYRAAGQSRLGMALLHA
jgi:hypothetical protein